jgi:hypothetical protein
MKDPQRSARIAGMLYVVLIALGATAELIRQNLIVVGDATGTADNVRASGDLLRVSMFADFGAHLSYLIVAVILYGLLRESSRTLSVLFLTLASVSVAMMCINLVNQFAAILIIDGPSYLDVFAPQQLDAFTLFFLELQDYGYVISGIFFGGWLLPLGIAAWKSGRIPRVIAVLLMIAPVGYFTDLTVRLAAPQLELASSVALGFSALAEFSLCLYLLIRGVRAPVAAL